MKPKILAFVYTYMHRFQELEDRYHFYYYTKIGKNPEEYVDSVLSDLQKKGIKVDGVIGDQDDTSILAAIAAQKLGLIGPDPKAIYTAQHKAYFSAYAEQANPHYPKTFLLTPGMTDFSKLPFPGFEKPSKGSLSRYAYMIQSPGELSKRLKSIEKIERRYLPWFDAFFRSQHKAFGHPDESYIPIDTFLYQPFLDFEQYTVDGLVFGNEVTILGFTKSVYSEDRKSFLSFDFPAKLSENLKEEVKTVCSKLFQLIGFNMEFFVTDDDHMIIIELNTRISGQFIPLMHQLYESNNLDMVIQVALGKKPHIQTKKEQLLASSFPLRIHRDFIVEHVPSEEYYRKLKKQFDVLDIRIVAKQGKKLSDYPQDGYSFRYAIVDIAGKTKQEIHDKLELVKMHLGIVFRPV